MSIKLYEDASLLEISKQLDRSIENQQTLIESIMQLCDEMEEVNDFGMTFTRQNGFGYSVLFANDELTFTDLYNNVSDVFPLGEINYDSLLNDSMDGMTIAEVLMDLSDSQKLNIAFSNISARLSISESISYSDALAIVSSTYGNVYSTSRIQLESVLTAYPNGLSPKDWLVITEANYKALQEALTNESFELDTTKAQIQSFVGSVLSGVISTVALIATTMLAFINPIIGIIAAGLFTALSFLFSAGVDTTFDINNYSPNRLWNVPLTSLKNVIVVNDSLDKLGITTNSLYKITTPWYEIFLWGRAAYNEFNSTISINVYARVDSTGIDSGVSMTTLNSSEDGFSVIAEVTNTVPINATYMPLYPSNYLDEPRYFQNRADREGQATDITTTVTTTKHTARMLCANVLCYYACLVSGDVNHQYVPLTATTKVPVAMSDSVSFLRYLNVMAQSVAVANNEDFDSGLNLPRIALMVNYFQSITRLDILQSDLTSGESTTIDHISVQKLLTNLAAIAYNEYDYSDRFVISRPFTTPKIFCCVLPEYTTDAVMKTAICTGLAVASLGSALGLASRGFSRLMTKYQTRSVTNMKRKYNTYRADPSAINEKAYLSSVRAFNFKGSFFGWNNYDASSCLPVSVGGNSGVLASIIKTDEATDNTKEILALIR